MKDDHNIPMRKTRSQTQAENAAKKFLANAKTTTQQRQQVAQREMEEIKNMMTYFRVHELQLLLSAFNVHHAGRKSELQKRAIDLLQSNFAEVAAKIREIDRNSSYGNSEEGSSPRLDTAHSSHSNNQQLSQQQLHQQQQQQQLQQLQHQAEQQAQHHQQSSQVSTSVVTASVQYHHHTDFTRTMYQSQIQVPVQTDVRTAALTVGNNLLAAPPFSNNMTPGYPIHPDVRLKKLAFYDVIATLLRPSTLVPASNQRLQEAAFYFTLTPQQATEIATNRDIRNGSKIEHTIQVQLRFCLLESSCEQDDCFPPNVIVKVNNKICPLPNPIPTNRPNVEPKRPPRPVNVTSNVKLSPTVTNSITVQWCPDFTRGYVISAFLVRKLTSQQLLTRMKQKGIKPADYTRALIKEKLTEDADCEIATTMLKVSLNCPLGKMRMSIPCRASTCSHLQCFDASLYLQMNERKATWNCPVCDKPALYDTLVIDGYFQEVLASPLLSANDSEIQLHKDGSWSTHLQEIEIKTLKAQKVVTEVISDDLEIVTEVQQKPIKMNHHPVGSPVGTLLMTVPPVVSSVSNNEPTSTTNNDTVDLTLSDSDDDLPLLRRKSAPTSSKNISSTTTAVPSAPIVASTSSSSSSSSSNQHGRHLGTSHPGVATIKKTVANGYR